MAQVAEKDNFLCAIKTLARLQDFTPFGDEYPPMCLELLIQVLKFRGRRVKLFCAEWLFFGQDILDKSSGFCGAVCANRLPLDFFVDVCFYRLGKKIRCCLEILHLNACTQSNQPRGHVKLLVELVFQREIDEGASSSGQLYCRRHSPNYDCHIACRIVLI